MAGCVLTAQELIVNIWNTLAAQSAHSSLIARRFFWLAVYLYMNRIGNTTNIMCMYTCYIYIYSILRFTETSYYFNTC